MIVINSVWFGNGVECYYFYESVVFNNFMTSLFQTLTPKKINTNDEFQNGYQKE